MTDVGDARPTIEVGKQRVLSYLDIVAQIARYNGCGIGRGIQHFGECVGNLCLKMTGKSALELYETTLINRVGAAVEKRDAAECRIRTHRCVRPRMAEIRHRR